MKSNARIPNSGIKKGYRYESLTRKQKAAQALLSFTHTGRDLHWANKIAEFHEENPGFASDRNTIAWHESRQRMYVIIFPDGKRVRTKHLINWCKRNGHKTSSHLCRISKFHAGDPLDGSRYYKGLDCYKVGTLINRKLRT